MTDFRVERGSSSSLPIGTAITPASNFGVLYADSSSNLAADNTHFAYVSSGTELMLGDVAGLNPTYTPIGSSLSIFPQNSKLYGLYIDAGGAPSYSFYNGNAAQSYFAGNVSIHAPGSNTAYLTLGAGTASVNTSPLKWTTGTLLSSIEDSAMEYNSGQLYISSGVTRYPFVYGGVGKGFAGGTKIIGGTATTDDLTLQSTSGNGAANNDIIFLNGNNGANEAARILHDGTFSYLGVGIAAPTAFFHVNGTSPASVSSTPGTAAKNVITILGPTGGTSTGTSSPVGGIGSPISITSGVGGVANSASSGSGTGGKGGNIDITTSTGGATSHNVSGVTAIGGAGGNLTLTTGNGAGGTNSNSSGAGTGGAGGTLALVAGNGNNGTAGASSTGSAGAGGPITITAGNAGAPAGGSSLNSASGGAITVLSGTGSQSSSSSFSAGTGGNISITTGGGGTNSSSGSAGSSGALTIATGTGGTSSSGSNGSGGNITIQTGSGGSGSATTGSSSGNITIQPLAGGTGSSTGGNGGNVSIQAGSGYNGSPSTGGTGGNTTLIGGTGGPGTSTQGTAGTVTVRGGTGGGSSANITGKDGGLVTVSGGTGGQTGSSTSGGGGELRLTGGVCGSNSGGSNGAGGVITFQTALTTTLTTCGTIDKNGRWFVGGTSTSPTALLHLAAGSATASTAPLKLTSGTNNTTAEPGAFEYNGTNLFFTRTGTTRENILVAVDNAAAPTTTLTPAFTSYYGGNTNALGDPNRWMSINILGVVYKIPMYT